MSSSEHERLDDGALNIGARLRDELPGVQDTADEPFLLGTRLERVLEKALPAQIPASFSTVSVHR